VQSRWDTLGEHKQVISTQTYPAGKALNISRVLAWMSIENTAAGLWGSDDFVQLDTYIKRFCPLIRAKMTVSTGITRHNITIINLRNSSEMHLRAPSELATKKISQAIGQEFAEKYYRKFCMRFFRFDAG